MDASIVLATYNRKKLLETCLRCINAQDYPVRDFEVIVVDDGSTDGSIDLVKDWTASYRLRCISAGHNGIGPARNLGVSEATGDIIIFIDDDAFIPPWFISEHMKSHREAAGPVYVAGPALNVSGQEKIEQPPVTALKYRTQAWLDFFGDPFVGVNISCPRDQFLLQKGFDTRFGRAYGYQDTELGLRFRLSGVSGVRNRRAYVLHHMAGTPTLELEMKKRRERGGTAAIFYAKYPLPEVKKIIRWERMKWDSRFERWGLLRWATPERAAAMRESGHPLYPVVRKILLTHLFAAALRQGLAEVGIAAEG
ncbi:MAG: hypothetical protein H6Q76_1455 [Firmicutes bacterium]|nr:hypothetical protein [Bacillota bacterium]